MAYTRAIYFTNLDSGSDAARTALTGCNMTNSSGVVTVNKTAHGLVHGAVVNVPTGTYSGGWLIKRTDADNFTLHTMCAIGKMTITGTPSVDETFVVGSQTFTFKTTRGSAGQVTIGASIDARVRNIVDAISADLGGVGANYFAYAGSTVDGVPPTGTAYVTIHYMQPGTGGNSITFTESATGIAIDGSGTLTGGADSTYSADRSTVSITPFGGMNWTDAWLTITGGITAARVVGSDYNAISKTADPVSIGNGKWEDAPSGGFAPTTVNISSSTNATPIEITTSTNHNLVTGDVALITGHNINYTANGNWQITYVSATKFTLDNSVGVATGGASGTIRKVNSKCVILATAQTQNVVTTEDGWIVNNAISANATTSGKRGYAYIGVMANAPSSANTMQCYKTISTADFSAYQKISLWVRNSVAIANNSTWNITLCSDTSGATPVDTFVIPAIPSIGRWIPLTIARTGGGNLGSAIQSIAVNIGSTVPSNSAILSIDNIIACTTSGMCLQSLISKNGSAQGGTEGFYGIQSINGKVVVLDENTNTVSTAGRGYSGASETVETFIRSTFKTAMAASSTTAVSTLNDSGTLGNLIAYEFGYEVGTTNQNGETFLDGLNGNGYGIYSSSKPYNSINRGSCVRYNTGLYLTLSDNNSVSNYMGNCNTSQGIYVLGLNCSYSNLFICNNSLSTFAAWFGNNSKITNIYLKNNIGSGYGGNVWQYIYNADASNNGIYGIQTSSNNMYIYDSVFKNNASGAIGGSGQVYLRNTLFLDTIEYTGIVNVDTVAWSYDHDQTDGNHWGFFYGGTFNWQTATKHLTEAGAWKTAITGSSRASNYKVKLPVAEVAGIASTNLTVTAWVKKDHATNIACRLVCYADDALGITEQAATKANDTDWEQLSITLNSAHLYPVFKVYLETWWVAGTSDSYLGTITTT